MRNKNVKRNKPKRYDPYLKHWQLHIFRRMDGNHRKNEFLKRFSLTNWQMEGGRGVAIRITAQGFLCQEGQSRSRRAWFEGNLCKPVPTCRLSIICEEIGIGSVATHHMVTTYPTAVEGLYCKRPIQCLASSDQLTPHPVTARRVCTPRLRCVGRTNSLRRGGGGSIVRKTPDTALYPNL